ncbi:MAG TPA: hypothetical protein DCL66_12635 [Gammaproteobacteria bacterium]|nr:hypothetical protein [Gammaproteobacteria bacterium]
MFIWLENTSLALWVSESYYAYPALLSLHIVGLAMVVGLTSMQNLKLLGLFFGLTLAGQSALIKLALAGFCLNLFSGLLLFSSQASYLITSLPFLLKISFIATAMVVSVLIQVRIKSSLSASSSLKALALASLMLWSSAIIAGRLIAYV